MDYHYMIKKMFSDDLKDVKEALERGAEINVQQKDSTPLLQALLNDNINMAKFLIRKGAHVNCIKLLRNERMLSPLVKCINRAFPSSSKITTYLEVLEMLLEHGANPNQAETYGFTPLTRAVDIRNEEITKTLIKYGADVNLKDNRGRLPLEIAIENEDLNIIKLLLDEGAEFSIQQVFLKAIKTENLEIIKLLIERGAKLNLQLINGKTPLTYALEIGIPDIVQLLLATGADVNLADASGDTPLPQAIKMGKMKMVKLLCQKEVDLGRDFPVKTALDENYLNILKYLIEMGADFNVIGNNGRTPLTAAVEEHHFGLVKLLLDRGADVNQVDGAQTTAFSLAVATKNLRIAKYLEERGATVECVSEIKEIAEENGDWKAHFEHLL